MQLTYRSARYEMNQYAKNTPVIKPRKNQAIGMYRGTISLIQLPDVGQPFQFIIPLKYRGVAYSSLR